MKAELKPLDSKYYGTVIEIIDGRLERRSIKVWLRSENWDDGSMDPSRRELEAANLTIEEYRRLYAESYDDIPIDLSGGHYETADSLLVAEAIIRALAQIVGGNKFCNAEGPQPEWTDMGRILDLVLRARRYETALREIEQDDNWKHGCDHSAIARAALTP